MQTEGNTIPLSRGDDVATIRNCVVCTTQLSGNQRKFCASEVCKKQGNREAWIKKTYGITMAEWNAIWVEQGERCAVCKRKPRVKKDGTVETFHLDHEHRNGPEGPIRGICCPYCNTRLIGRLKDAKLAQALADYLTNPPAARALGREVIAPGRVRRRRRRSSSKPPVRRNVARSREVTP